MLFILANIIVGCGPTSAPTSLSQAYPAVGSTMASQPPTPSPSPSPTWTELPTVPAAANPSPRTHITLGTASATPSRTATDTRTIALMPAPTLAPSATATDTDTPTWTPAPTLAPSATAKWTDTPVPPGPTITPTQTITPTPTGTVTPTPLFSPTPMPTAIFARDVIHFLLIGLDSTQNLRDQNTDVIIVAAVNRDTKQVSMLSIPRDLWVHIPTHEWNRINVAHKLGFRGDYPGGGIALLIETIETNIGIPIDHWIRVDYRGFARVVDALGGVEMTVACPVNLRYQAPTSPEEQEMYLEPGIYQMDGATALRYVRTRRDSSDFARAPRQQQFLRAMWDQARKRLQGADLLPTVRGLWSSLSDSYDTDMNLFDVLPLVPLALEIQPQHIRNQYIGPRQTTNWTNADGWRVLLPNSARIQEVVASLYAPPSITEERAASESARIRVRNGTYRRQLAQIGADQLRWHGLEIVDTGLADRPDYKTSQIIIYNDRPTAIELLTRLLRIKPENVVHYQEGAAGIPAPDPSQPADIMLILGNDYDPCR